MIPEDFLFSLCFRRNFSQELLVFGCRRRIILQEFLRERNSCFFSGFIRIYPTPVPTKSCLHWLRLFVNSLTPKTVPAGTKDGSGGNKKLPLGRILAS